MSKEKIIEYFSDINYAYNDCTRLETLKNMLNELEDVVRCKDCVIQDGKEYIVSMGKVAQEEAYGMIQYRMYMDMKPFVRCKDCKHTPYSDNNDYWCDKWEREFGSDWFCADGERKEKEDE